MKNGMNPVLARWAYKYERRTSKQLAKSVGSSKTVGEGVARDLGSGADGWLVATDLGVFWTPRGGPEGAGISLASIEKVEPWETEVDFPAMTLVLRDGEKIAFGLLPQDRPARDAVVALAS